MRLRQVLGEVDVVDWVNGSEAEVEGLAYDSRKVALGSLFVCVPGARSDGHDFAAAAAAAGAVALVVERVLPIDLPQAVVADSRLVMGQVAAAFEGRPTSKLTVVGITGTNGKTTTAYLVRHMLESAGTSCGLLGTIQRIVGGQSEEAQRTTAEAIDLQADFRRMLEAGDEACAIEVSSHALALGRVTGTEFAVAAFTNLTPEHLDFHPDMESYFAAKRLLFVGGGRAGSIPAVPGAAVINLDDPFGARLAAELETEAVAGTRLLTYSAAGDEAADLHATDIAFSAVGTSFSCRGPGGERVDVRMPLPGRFNVANALCALGAAVVTGVDFEVAAASLASAPAVPGRLQPVAIERDFQVFVDYAHTPDSLENVLATARELTARQLIVVFGAGGDRDRAKRPLMGEVASRLADVAVVTSDNPRSEQPEAIIAEILGGMPGADGTNDASTAGGAGSTDPLVAGGSDEESAEVLVEADRRRAIAMALELASDGDVVVIAGKGHEQGQEFAGGRKVPFDDVTVALEYLGSAAGR